MRALLPQENFGDVGHVERVGVVVYYGILVEVGRIEGSAHLTGENVVDVVGYVVGKDENDVVVVPSVALKHLVHVEHVGLVTVVLPFVGPLHEHCPLVLERFVGNVDVLVVQLLLYQGVPFPRSERGGGAAVALRAAVVYGDKLVFVDHPVHIGALHEGCERLAVEAQHAAGADKLHAFILFEEQDEGTQTKLVPNGVFVFAYGSDFANQLVGVGSVAIVVLGKCGES